MIASSLVIAAISTVVGGVFKLIATRMENQKQLEEAKLRALNAKATVTKDAREYENKGFQFTRRIIALTMTLCVVALPYFSVLWYQSMYPLTILNDGAQPSVWFGYETIKSGFWPFTSDTTVTNWQEFKGLVITPWHTDMFAMIMGLYFGNRLGNGRQ